MKAKYRPVNWLQSSFVLRAVHCVAVPFRAAPYGAARRRVLRDIGLGQRMQ